MEVDTEFQNVIASIKQVYYTASNNYIVLLFNDAPHLCISIMGSDIEVSGFILTKANFTLTFNDVEKTYTLAELKTLVNTKNFSVNGTKILSWYQLYLLCCLNDKVVCVEEA